MAKNNAGNKKSALKQLRSALSKAGITGPAGASSSKIRKKQKSGSLKKVPASSDRGKKLQAIQAAFNPFEMKINKTKFNVLGLKQKTQVNVAVARQRALEKRKNTLGKELAAQNRVGGISDRRIGENDPTMNPEEKMVRRFALERQKRARRTGGGGGDSIYNLEDGSDVEGEITMLTHFGQSIAEIDEFGGDDDNDDDAAAAARGEGSDHEEQDITAEHFGRLGMAAGADESEGPERKKTKAEVMMEVIAKSKQHKYERQMAKEEDDGIRRELDDDFESVRALLFASPEAAYDDSINSKPMMKAAAGEDGKAGADEYAYDAHVREMAFERRARPQNRLKTEEELAREERERLERAERHRLRRMEGIPSDSENDSDSDDGDGLAAYKSKQRRAPVADDLGDNFAKAEDDSENEGEDDNVDLGDGLRGAQSQSDDDEEDEEDEEEDESESDLDSDSEDGSAESSGQDAKPSAAPAKKKAQGVASSSSKSGAEIPFTFDAPADYDAWVALAGEYSLEQQLVVIRRLRALYHIKLAPQNKQKLGDLALILVEYLAVLAEQNPPVPATVVDEVVKHIGELAAIDAGRFGEHCRQRVIEMHQRISDIIRADDAIDSVIPASDIALMRVFVAVFSASDRFHPVVTPMLIAIGQYLSHFTFATRRSVAGALVLVGIVHEAQRLSRRLVPEALNFVFAALAASVCERHSEDDKANSNSWVGQYPISRRQSLAYGTLLSIGFTEACKRKVEPVRWSWLLASSDGSSDVKRASALSTEEKYAVLHASLHLCRRFVDTYFSQTAFVELFGPLKDLLATVSERLSRGFKQQQAPEPVLKTLRELQTYLDEQLEQAKTARQPLTLQNHRPLAIASVAPKFETSYSLDVHYDPDRDRNESIKLRRQVNRERRGVIRELRRDAQFIAGQRLAEQREKDKVYSEKMKRAWGVLEDDQSQMKKMDKQRIRERKGKL
ncbi:nucleolar complex protein 14 [Coemansia sp. RSA 1939]|nr:nucleolar complex protein 14 [Coemansia sp. RSA 1939]KAJ2615839.1 nucleolar complex protein 14 [Coemansia sp. RSA 1804]KAJ2694929.1 nucleolar complex protein 14 [Coemansia sp. RSA 1285]